MSKTDIETRIAFSASLCAHSIDGQKNDVKSNPLAKYVGFTDDAPVKIFTAGKADIHACYVAETERHIILAFRGTVLRNTDDTWQFVLDWLDNFIAKPVEIKDIKNNIGKLHWGFSNAIEELWKQTESFQLEVEKRMAEKKDKSLIITGYSKGGALAPIAAAFLNERLNLNTDRMSIRIFEPPHPGNEDFAEYFKKTFKDTLRYEYQDDIVPYLPPSQKILNLLSCNKKFKKTIELIKEYTDIGKWNYEPVGTLRFVDWEKRIVQHNKPFKRIQHLKELSLDENPNKNKKMFTDHFPIRKKNGSVISGNYLDLAIYGQELPELNQYD